jgi:plastocyanin
MGLLAAALAAAGCSGARAPQVHQVAIQGFAYSPMSVAAAPGDTVVFINRDVTPHTATSKQGGWDSGPIAPGASWRLVVKKESAAPYACTFHPTMKATLSTGT